MTLTRVWAKSRRNERQAVSGGTYRHDPMWHPWRHLRDLGRGVEVRWGGLANDELGKTEWLGCDRVRISLSRDQGQAERRCTATHEIIHHERGPLPLGSTDADVQREEAIVDDLAARRLIPIGELAEALAWTLDFDELTEDLWVDEETARTRIAGLTAEERRLIEARLDAIGEAS